MDCFDYLEQARLMQVDIGTSPWCSADFDREVYYGSWSKVLAEDWSQAHLTHEF